MKLAYLHEKPRAKEMEQITNKALTTIFNAFLSVLSGTIVVSGFGDGVVVLESEHFITGQFVDSTSVITKNWQGCLSLSCLVVCCDWSVLVNLPIIF